jgi:hypothetical protein
MFKALANLNVLEILRVGLAGLCFLLSLLAFWLIQREQQRASSPRKGILRAIYAFMSVNLLTAMLVAVAGYFGPQRQRGMTSDNLGAKTYLTDRLTFLVDFTKWQAQVGGPVEITRTDGIHKVSATRDDYVIPYFTTGDGINAKFLSYSNPKPEFVPDVQPGFTGHHYLYKIQIGDEPAEFTELVSTMFTFLNGFKNSENDWWQASIGYPSKIVSVVMHFPDGKPCKQIHAFKVSGIRGDKQPIKDNPPLVSNEGAIVTWVGLNLEENSRIQFNWEW